MRSAFLLALTIFLSVPQPSGAAGSFPRPAEMEHQIRFWRSIFTQYSQDQIVVHDTADLDRIYTVLDFRTYSQAGMTPAQIEPYKEDAAEAEGGRLRGPLQRPQ